MGYEAIGSCELEAPADRSVADNPDSRTTLCSGVPSAAGLSMGAVVDAARGQAGTQMLAQRCHAWFVRERWAVELSTAVVSSRAVFASGVSVT